ncbi:FMN-dependent NADH-azoreductase [Pseudoprimorskyibacter insulae]|uniref:FMN dependent NADH:quinone oxidoreductase n=1 Tax=Pseudoprimorskyibacter insulae TaxID=1695997 RepID=A0A2R8AUV5_9RHOB|nr:NAD(P)H-dependent oxidoreductase [Pseudoprimorskyibacter insulae]SPF79770.1 FMN-dependent NADH-azoreductase 1 [Pseudoprimorskyibacter insulae]
MTKLLHIVASPRGEDSKSTALAEGHIADRRLRDPGLEVDTLDLFAADLPDFGGIPASAKMAVFGGVDMTEAENTAWAEVARLTRHFIAADHYVISVPMWNGGVPYRLKQYIDIITQPGMLFGFDPATGYSGLLEGKRATLVVTSGVWSPGAAAAYGVDFHTNYMEWWLGFIGVQNVDTLRFQPTVLTADPAAGYAAARQKASVLA